MVNMHFIDEAVFRPVIKELIQYYYNNLGNGAGGWCHVVLDDGNLEDESLWGCQEMCEENNDQIGYLIATTLRSFTIEEREEMYGEYWGMK